MGAHTSGNGLTAKQQAAADHFIVHGDVGAAYRSAYSTGRMKDTTIAARATEVFKHPKVVAYVDAAKKAATSKAVMTRQEALEILSEIGRGKLSDFINENGEIDKEAVSKAGYSLEEFSIAAGKYGDNKKVKVRNPIQAIERLSKMLGWDKQAELDIGGVTFHINLKGEE